MNKLRKILKYRWLVTISLLFTLSVCNLLFVANANEWFGGGWVTGKLIGMTGVNDSSLIIGSQTSNNSSLFIEASVLPPTDVSATKGTYPDKVRITWTKSVNATEYIVYRNGVNISGTLGDVALYDDTTAPLPTITGGTATATKCTFTDKVSLSLSGEMINDGPSVTYYVVAINPGWTTSSNSLTDTGYMGTGGLSLTYQWQVSAGDSDAAYSDIGGATTEPYDYMSPPAFIVNPPSSVTVHLTAYQIIAVSWSGASVSETGRYYRCVLSATGASDQNSSSDRGYTNDTINNFEVYSDPASGGTYATLVGSSATSPLGSIAESALYFKVKAESTNGTFSILSIYGVLGLPLPPTNVTVVQIQGSNSTTSFIFNFTKGIDADSTIIVLGNDTTPNTVTDGIVIYNGTASTYTYTSGSADSESYIGLWGSNSQGNSANKVPITTGGINMIFVGLILLGVIGSVFAIYKRNILFAIGASVVWFFLISYTRANPLPGIASGSSTDSLFIGICVAFSVATMMTTFVIRANDNKKEAKEFKHSSDYRSDKEINRHNSKDGGYESAEDYQVRLSRLSHKKK